MIRFGQLLAIVDRIPRTLESIPGVSQPDFRLTAERLEHAAARVRTLATCQAADRAALAEHERGFLLPEEDYSHFEPEGGARVRLP